MKVCVATIAVGLPFRFTYLEGTQSKKRYCKKHGYDFVFETKTLDPTRPHAWSKIKLVQRLLPQYDWVFWIDADTLILNDSFSVESFIEEGKSFTISEQALGGINSGIFLIQNTPLMHQLLEEVYTKKEALNHPFWEQGALEMLLEENGVYRSQVHLVPQRVLYAYPREACRYLEQDLIPGLYQEGDFLIHLAGRKVLLIHFFFLKKYAKKMGLYKPLALLLTWLFKGAGRLHPRLRSGYLIFKHLVLVEKPPIHNPGLDE